MKTLASKSGTLSQIYTGAQNKISTPYKTSLDITWLKDSADEDDCTLAELLEIIKDKSAAIAVAVGKLETLIGDMDE